MQRERLSQGKNFRCGEGGMCIFLRDLCYCGKKGCLDAYCSAKRLADSKGGKLEEFFCALKTEEAEGEALWEDYTEKLALWL